VASTETIMPYDEFAASRFYREWAQPRGYCDAIWAMLEKSTTALATISVLRHDRHGLVDDRTRWRMGQLAPHFRRAVAIGRVVDLKTLEFAALADTLDGLAAAMFLVDPGGRIAHANASGLAMLAEGSVLRGTGGKITATDTEAARLLRDVFLSTESGDLALGAKGPSVPLLARDGTRFVAHVLPLTAGKRRSAGNAYSATAAVFVRKTAFDPPHPLEALATAYKLTPAETRVLMAIVQIGGIPEAAPVLGISAPTARTHLQRIFAKTDTTRQADLVKLVASYMNPLA
jgi:DNA-binding CsgD family transcriptional regulator